LLLSDFTYIVIASAGASSTMQTNYLIYSSRPFGFDASTLNSILVVARRNNVRDGITGALIVRADLYLQWLEGPAAALAALFARICADDRHLEITKLDSGTLAERRFDAWAMRDDPARSWLWDAAAVANGAVAAAPVSEIHNVFDRMMLEPV